LRGYSNCGGVVAGAGPRGIMFHLVVHLGWVDPFREGRVRFSG
jgi:hypothetical protein